MGFAYFIGDFADMFALQNLIILVNLAGPQNQIDMNTSERFVDSSECGQGSREMGCEGDQRTRHTHRDLLK